MRLIGIGTVKNEADIIESFVRHNLGRLDALVLIDDGSVDGTREILLSLEAEGLNLVTLEWDGSAGLEQSRKLSELLLVLASRMNFDWIFPLDADEAIDCESRAALEKALGKAAPGYVGTLPWRTYIPTVADDWAQANPFQRIVNRKTREAPQFYKVAIPESQLKFMPIVIASGSHTARRTTALRQLSMTALEDVALAHFPVRSPEQLVSKVVCGWLSLFAEGSGRPSRGFHWREMYAQFVRNGAPTTEEIERLARGYSGQRDDGHTTCSPLGIADQSQLQYRKNANLPLFVTIARTAEQIIGRSLKLTRRSKSVNMLRDRTAWRHRRPLFGSSQSDQNGAILAYLGRRFSGHAQFVDEKDGPISPKGFAGTGSSSTNQLRAIVLVRRHSLKERFGTSSWLEAGWAVDHTATLAVRLLARSSRVRRYSIVLVPCEKDSTGRVLADGMPAPSNPGWRENLCFGVLRGYFLAIKFYWFFRSLLDRERHKDATDPIGVDKRARSLGIGV